MKDQENPIAKSHKTRPVNVSLSTSNGDRFWGMKMKVNFVDDVSVLSESQKKIFYMILSNNLTTSIRCLFSEEQDDAVECVKSINEVIHKSLNRLFDIESGRNSWCEIDMWEMIKIL